MVKIQFTDKLTPQKKALKSVKHITNNVTFGSSPLFPNMFETSRSELEKMTNLNMSEDIS